MEPNPPDNLHWVYSYGGDQDHRRSRLFATQIYSDEAGVRKPNPPMIWAATAELGVPARECWFVGDSRRDVVCARRAEVAMAILRRSDRTDQEDPAA